MRPKCNKKALSRFCFITKLDKLAKPFDDTLNLFIFMEGMKCSPSNRLSVSFPTFAASISPSALTPRNKGGLEFLVLRNVPLYLRRNKSSKSFFYREWSTYGPLDSHGPTNCATGGFTIPCIVLQDLFYCSDTTRSCRPTIAVHLWLRKPFSQKVILLIRCIQNQKFTIRVLLLFARLFRAIFSHPVFYLLY